MSKMDFEITSGRCSACKGVIVKRSYVPYIPRQSRDVIGPGSENIATEANRTVDGYHCDHCGLEYYKLPKK